MLSGVINAGLEKYKDSGFTDVQKGAWYEKAVAWAVANNIVSGYGDGRFGPNDNITREQMAVITVNFARAAGLEFTASVEEIEFTDAGKISGYAKDAVRTLQMAGIISGKGNNTFDPKGTATRAEAARIITDIIKAMVNSK